MEKDSFINTVSDMKHMFQKSSELEIILKLEKAPTYIRDLAIKINSSPATVMRKLNELKKNNIVDSKDEGRNVRYFIKDSLEASNYLIMAEIYRLNKFIYFHPELKLLIEEIKAIAPELLILIFGSYAKECNNDNSDIDLYIETSNKTIKNKVEMLNSKLSVKIGKFDKNSFLGKEIIKDKILLSGFERYYRLIRE